jgi:hypothetical protein
LAAAAVMALALGTAFYAARRALSFSEHRARRSGAVLDPARRRELIEALGRTAPRSVEQAIAFANAEAGRTFGFGLGHRTTLKVATEPREANCIEYAHLFAYAFDEAASQAHLPARAYVVHSAEARLFGRKVPLRGWGDHDWVLVEDRDAGRSWYVDPTLADFGLGWDVSANVRGAVAAP